MYCGEIQVGGLPVRKTARTNGEGDGKRVCVGEAVPLTANGERSHAAQVGSNTRPV